MWLKLAWLVVLQGVPVALLAVLDRAGGQKMPSKNNTVSHTGWVCRCGFILFPFDSDSCTEGSETQVEVSNPLWHPALVELAHTSEDEEGTRRQAGMFRLFVTRIYS